MAFENLQYPLVISVTGKPFLEFFFQIFRDFRSAEKEVNNLSVVLRTHLFAFLLECVCAGVGAGLDADGSCPFFSGIVRRNADDGFADSLPSPGRLDREPAVPFKAPVAGRENRDRFSGAQCRLRLEDGPDYSCVVNFGLVLFLAGQCQKQWCDG